MILIYVDFIVVLQVVVLVQVDVLMCVVCVELCVYFVVVVLLDVMMLCVGLVWIVEMGLDGVLQCLFDDVFDGSFIDVLVVLLCLFELVWDEVQEIDWVVCYWEVFCVVGQFDDVLVVDFGEYWCWLEWSVLCLYFVQLVIFGEGQFEQQCWLLVYVVKMVSCYVVFGLFKWVMEVCFFEFFEFGFSFRQLRVGGVVCGYQLGVFVFVVEDF